MPRMSIHLPVACFVLLCACGDTAPNNAADLASAADLSSDEPDLTDEPDLAEVPDLTESTPTCTDNAKNGSETDVDCGGTCPRCGTGRMCMAGSDCGTNVCSQGICIAASCSDGVRNGNESDVDCGGSCTRCGDTKMCNAAADCLSNVCVSKLCVAGACNDGAKNGDETDVDCGGSCSDCAAGKTCKLGTDCVSKVCSSAGVCQNPSCIDGVKNGTEVDVDCGGGACPACVVGKTCLVSTDCASKVCIGGTCRCGGVLKVTNTTAGALSAYQVMVDATAITTACGKNLRVLDAAGAAVPFCFENTVGECGTDTSQTTRVWLRVPSLPASGSASFSVVQNSTNGATAGGTVFDFYEDWNTTISTTKWQLITTSCSPLLDTGRLRSGGATGTMANWICGAMTKSYVLPLSSRVVTRFSVAASTSTSDCDPWFATVRPLFQTQTTRYAWGAGWTANDETPNESFNAYGTGTVFSTTAIRGNFFRIELQVNAAKQIRTCQSIDGKCSANVAWLGSPYNNLFLGSAAFGGVQWFYDWVYVRKMAATEPTAVFQ